MRSRLAILAVLLLAARAQAADGAGGGNLWLTPDQLGQKLLQAGDAAAAARTYADPRRRAYAELRAGDYAAAARDFEAFGDSDGQYDRGNALVGAGDLQGALQAYNAALARNPDNRDARRNRDLVAQALKQQEQQQQQQQGQQQQQPGTDRQPQKGEQSGQQQASSGDRNAHHGQSEASAAGKDNTGSSENEQQKAEARNEAGKRPDSGPDHTPNQAPASPPSGQSHQDTSTPAATDEAAQARRDVRDSVGGPAANEPAQATARQAQPGAAEDRTAPVPRTEQQLAQEQWLRRIPDDPGGLLRRKFMIEHMLRQQGRDHQQDQHQ